jgi:EAL domain-containing protein (putative c-di-GMP-specific phosphodiesterase class I)
MVNQAGGQYFRLHGLNYAFLLDNQNEATREYLPNVRITLFKLLSRIGAHIAIDQIEPSAIGLVNISFLGAEIAQLHWHSAAENELYGRQEIVDKFRRSGIQPVLIRVDQERAHRVGQGLGIEMYQGFFIDDMLKSDANRAAASSV